MNKSRSVMRREVELRGGPMQQMDCINQQARERELTKRSQAERLAIADSLIASVWEEYLNGSIDRGTLQVAAYIQANANRIVWKLNELNNPNTPNTLKALDCISRQDAIDRINKQREHLRPDIYSRDKICDAAYRICAEFIERLPSAQPEQRWIPAESVQNVPNEDLVSRKTVIEALLRDRQQADALMDKYLKNGYMALRADAKAERNRIEKDIAIIEQLPSAQPTLCGYDIDHLMLIAVVLRKENLPPERVTEALTDIGRIISIVRNEFEESLRKAVEQCKDGVVSRNDA